jgi:hypothetical protein
VFAPCGRNFRHARRALFSRGDFAVSPRGSISTTLLLTTFGSSRLGTPWRRTQAANLRKGRRANEGGLTSNVIHTPVGAEPVPVVVADVIVDPWGCAPAAWDEESAIAASTPKPKSAARVAARTALLIDLSAMSIPRLRSRDGVDALWPGRGCATVTDSGVLEEGALGVTV